LFFIFIFQVQKKRGRTTNHLDTWFHPVNNNPNNDTGGAPWTVDRKKGNNLTLPC